jgi:hypothetical protein
VTRERVPVAGRSRLLCSEPGCRRRATHTWWRSQFTPDGSLEPVGGFCGKHAEEDFPDGVLIPIGEKVKL